MLVLGESKALHLFLLLIQILLSISFDPPFSLEDVFVLKAGLLSPVVETESRRCLLIGELAFQLISEEKKRKGKRGLRKRVECKSGRGVTPPQNQEK